ncbi:hypothetical protein JMJ56_24780 [Belnapia sp. T18]|uniref:Uncharacterized protein n=1 Tax=Belnapia arida TaxID=2804533 RepID=A0ABS1U962_9PROT|nr:hypothetical protein [Belnapia arida]MBL6081215.1 hypothetical protein [Belnapia arida]
MSDTIAHVALLLRRELLATSLGLLFLAMAVPTLFGLALDGRTIVGVSVWLKPFKFQLSLAVHVLTVALALGVIERRVREGRTVRVVLLIFSAMLLFEVCWITVQGGRGLPSHFATSAFDLAMYVLMGIGATFIVLATALFGVLALRHPAPEVPRLVSLAVGLGLLISGIAGLVTGWAISLNNGAVVGSVGDAGLSIPLFGWSGTAGDIRAAHFVGLHAAQFLPLLGLALCARTTRSARSALVAASLLWSAATVGLLIQALAGHPFIPLG